VTSPASGDDLPDYAPIPRSALGPALNDRGYYVGRVERNLYWVTDGVYQSAFLITPDGVVLFDAPPSIGGNLRCAVDQIAAANGVTNTVTHLVYSHHHADHAGAAFGGTSKRSTCSSAPWPNRFGPSAKAVGKAYGGSSDPSPLPENGSPSSSVNSAIPQFSCRGAAASRRRHRCRVRTNLERECGRPPSRDQATYGFERFT
jgi:hypothetical protein